MSKINQIQDALRQLDGGPFQKLADAYLVEKGLGPVNSIGSVIGADKTRPGTPDTLVTTSEKKYVFAEYTTQQQDLLKKLRSDLDKCFDEAKTGVPVDRIERVILCFNGKLEVADERELLKTCQARGVSLELFGIDALAFDLYRHYPGLARDFLGIHLDTGQIVSPKQFVTLYNTNRLATRLDHSFHFREDEINHLIDALEAGKLVFVTGRAGIGKSRLTLEACRRFRDIHPDYEVLCVLGRHRDLWDDLQVWFSRPGNFLIFVDDANRVKQFEYVVDLLQHQREDQRIKVVATVRDYALAEVHEAAKPLGVSVNIKLERFTDEQIKRLITDEYGIVNFHYLERIVDIAQGNPRLAVMAAEVLKEGSLGSIYDVSALYDSYFSSVRKDLKSQGIDLKSADLLTVAALVSFFRVVDRSNEKMINAIEQAFMLEPSVFWETATRLHELEILDMYDDELVRVSDQVLGTYVFYLATIKEGFLNFSTLLRHFFPKLRHRLIDSINPVLNAFGAKRVISTIRPHIKQIRMELEKADNYNDLFHLYEVFWFTEPTDTLLWVYNQIDELEPEQLEITEVTFEKSSDVPSSPSVLNILRSFAFAGQEEIQMAVELLVLYLGKRPSEIPLILRILIEDYGFRPSSYLKGFEVQRAIIDKLWSGAKNGVPFVSRVFLTVASEYLYTHFESYEIKGRHKLRLTPFGLPNTPHLATMRKTIWQRLFVLYKNEDLQENVLSVVHLYNTSPLRITNSAIVKDDAEHLLPFLESVLDPNSYRHCTVMNDYLNLLEKHGVEIPESLRDLYRNDTYIFGEILLHDPGKRQKLHLSYKEYEKSKQDQLKNYTANYTLADYCHFLERCLEFQNALNEDHEQHQFRYGVVNALLLLADRDPDLYWEVLEYYLNLGDPLCLDGSTLVQKLLQHRDYDATFHFLNDAEFPTKRRWLFYLHESLPAETVNEVQLRHLYDLYQSAELADLPHNWDYLLKYLPLDSQVPAKVLKVLVKKSENEPRIAYTLDMLFNPYTEVVERLPGLFAEAHVLLKDAYLLAESTLQYNDYQGKVFNHLIDLNPTFIEDYINWKYSNTEDGWLSSYDDRRDYSFIWARPDHQEIMDKIIDCIFSHEQILFPVNPYLGVFFKITEERGEISNKIQQKQGNYLLQLIDERSDEANLMEYLFGVIAQFVPERRRQFVQRFLQRNRNFEVFKRLPLETSFTVWGSAVPMLQRRFSDWESLLPFLNTIDLLQHRQYVKDRMQGLEAQIEQEMKNDFIED